MKKRAKKRKRKRKRERKASSQRQTQGLRPRDIEAVLIQIC